MSEAFIVINGKRIDGIVEDSDIQLEPGLGLTLPRPPEPGQTFTIKAKVTASPQFLKQLQEEFDAMRSKHIEQIVEGIWNDLNDRAGIKHELGQLEEGIVLEIKDAWREIILNVTEPKETHEEDE